MKQSKLSIIIRGLIKENPVLVLVLGTCPTLAISTSVSAAIGMGLAATFVLVCSNIAISSLRKVIPDKVRLPAYITVIAAFVTIVQMLVQAFAQDLYSALGVYLPLITTNCAVLGVTVLNIDNGYNFAESIVCALGAGFGFMLAMVLFSGVRKRLEDAQPPKCFEGLPITLVAASVTALSFGGFGGIVESIFGSV